MASNFNEFYIQKKFTVNVISLLPRELHSETTQYISLQFQTFYRQRLEESLQCRGIYSLGAIRLSADYKIMRAKAATTWNYVAVTEEAETSSDGNISHDKLEKSSSLQSWKPGAKHEDTSDEDSRAIALQHTIENGDAYIILYDHLSQETAKEIGEDIAERKDKVFVPVVYQEVEESRKMSRLSLGGECRPQSSPSQLANAFERLCSIVHEEAGFIAPPKKARRVTRPSLIQRIYRNIRRRFPVQ